MLKKAPGYEKLPDEKRLEKSPDKEIFPPYENVGNDNTPAPKKTAKEKMALAVAIMTLVRAIIGLFK